MDTTAVFHDVFHRLIKQGRRAHNGSGCMYRMPDPNNNRVLKCGVGHMIDDADYHPAMENKSVSMMTQGILIEKGEQFANPIPAYIREDWRANLKFLQDVQDAHDTSRTGHDLIDAMEKLAKSHNITISPELLAEAEGVRDSWH